MSRARTAPSPTTAILIGPPSAWPGQRRGSRPRVSPDRCRPADPQLKGQFRQVAAKPARRGHSAVVVGVLRQLTDQARQGFQPHLNQGLDQRAAVLQGTAGLPVAAGLHAQVKNQERLPAASGVGSGDSNGGWLEERADRRWQGCGNPDPRRPPPRLPTRRVVAACHAGLVRPESEEDPPPHY